MRTDSLEAAMMLEGKKEWNAIHLSTELYII